MTITTIPEALEAAAEALLSNLDFYAQTAHKSCSEFTAAAAVAASAERLRAVLAPQVQPAPECGHPFCRDKCGDAQPAPVANNPCDSYRASAHPDDRGECINCGQSAGTHQPAPVAEVQAEAVAGAFMAARGHVWAEARQIRQLARSGGPLAIDRNAYAGLLEAVSDGLMALTPDDAQAALARRDAETRAKALREAADAVWSLTLEQTGKLEADPLGVWVQTLRAAEARIIALIKEPRA